MNMHKEFDTHPIQLSAIIFSLLSGGCSALELGLDQSIFDHQTDRNSKIVAEKITNNDYYYEKEDPRFFLAEAAKIAEKEGKYLEAASHWRKILDQFPFHQQALFEFSKMGRLANIGSPLLSPLFKAISNQPKDDALIAEVSKIYLSMKDYNNALKYVNQAINIDSMQWKYHSLKGAIYDKQGKHSTARQSYEEALSLSPNNPVIMNNYAVSRMMEGEINEAEVYALNSAEHKNASIQNYRTYAKILSTQGKFDEMKNFLDQKLDKYTASVLYKKVRAETASPVLWREAK